MKNVKLNKKLLSMMTAISLMASPVAALGDNSQEENTNTNFKLVTQDSEFTPLTMVDYVEGIANGYEYLTKFINYDNMQADLQCLYYLVNREYMDEDTESSLINNGSVYETNFAEQKYENFMRAYNLINVILDYNQSTIRHTSNSEDIIDISKLCYNEKDAKLINDIHVNYLNSYLNGEFNEENFQLLFKQLTTLNAAEQAGNSHELSVGARWFALNVEGGDAMQILRDVMQAYPKEMKYKYFDNAELNQGQWFIRDDVELDFECLNEFEVLVFYFGQLYHVVYDTVNNDLMKTFEENCTKTK